VAFGGEVDRSVGDALLEDEEQDGECGEGQCGAGGQDGGPVVCVELGDVWWSRRGWPRVSATAGWPCYCVGRSR
jgi:hypothetical protein